MTLSAIDDRTVAMGFPFEVPDSPDSIRSVSEAVAYLLSGPEGSLPGATSARVELEHRLPLRLERAFAEGDTAALLDVHKTLFNIYELSFGNPLSPAVAHERSLWVKEVRRDIEEAWLASELRGIEAVLPAASALRDEDAVIQWFVEHAREERSLDRRLIDYLAEEATLDEFKAFVLADTNLNYRFYDSIVLSQIHFSETVKQELSRHFWDECGGGDIRRAHTYLFTKTLELLDLRPPAVPVWDDWRPYAGYNLYLLFGLTRAHYFKAIGSLAMPELFDVGRDRAVVSGLSRVTGRAPDEFGYYYSHVEGDEEHGPAWLEHVIVPIIRLEPQAARELVIGGAIRMEFMRHFNDYLAEKFSLPRR